MTAPLGPEGEAAVSRIVAALALVLAVAAGAGCGGDSLEARQDRGITLLKCEEQTRHIAEGRVLVRLYRQGKLGTQEQIQDEIDAGGFPVKIFTPAGAMIPYERMSPRQQAALNEWKVSDRVFRIGQVQRRQAKRAAEYDC